MQGLAWLFKFKNILFQSATDFCTKTKGKLLKFWFICTDSSCRMLIFVSIFVNWNIYLIFIYFLNPHVPSTDNVNNTANLPWMYDIMCQKRLCIHFIFHSFWLTGIFLFFPRVVQECHQRKLYLFLPWFCEVFILYFDHCCTLKKKSNIKLLLHIVIQEISSHVENVLY